MKPGRILFAFTLLAAFSSVPLRASSLTFSLNPTQEAGQPATYPLSVAFSGTLTNTATANTCDTGYTDCLYLNAISFTFDQDVAITGLSGDSNIFYSGPPGILSDDGANSALYNSYTGPVFGIVIAPTTPVGIYTGSVSIYGAVDDPGNTTNLLATQSWSLVVAPEPTGFRLATLGLGLLLALRSLRKRATR